MIVVIDTNVVLGMFTAGHRTRPIFSAWFDGRLRWALSTEILLEYEGSAPRSWRCSLASGRVALVANPANLSARTLASFNDSPR